MENPLKNTAIKLRRTAKLTQILAKYGFQDLLGNRRKTDQAPANKGAQEANSALYERIRTAIEELGPTFVKFGQTLSAREDLLPKELITELKKLQDRVPPEKIDIIPYLEEELQIDIANYFQEIDTIPIASASIAQVYKAILIDGTPVILKVKRANVRKTIESDLLILRDLVDFLSEYSLTLQKINLKFILETFQKTLMEELSFIHEAKNISQFAQNFRDHAHIICMKVFTHLSNDQVLCISHIDGVKINDKQKLLAWGLQPENVIDRGLDLFLTQVLEHGFFHADPHPGNILVTKDGKLAFLDLGAMGRMLPSDQRLLEDFITCFINKDADGLIYQVKKMAIHIHVENEKKLKRDLLELFDMINSNALEDIDVKTFFSRFSNILNENYIIMPEHVYLLVRGIVMIEGIGRELLPGLNIVEKITPYIRKVVQQRLSMANLEMEFKQKMQNSYQLLDQAPETLRHLMQQLEHGDLRIRTQNDDIKQWAKEHHKSQSINRYLTIGCLFVVTGCLLISVDQYSIWGLPMIAWIFLILGFAFLIFAKLRSFRIGR